MNPRKPLLTKILLLSIALLSAITPRTAVADASSPCADNPFVRELTETGDDFRAVTLLKEQEFRLRGTAGGFECSRVLLGRYLKHEEYDVAEPWVDRMALHYGKFLSADSRPARLRAELAYLYGNYTEAERRLSAASVSAHSPSADAIDPATAATLRDFARFAAEPRGTKPVLCSQAPCTELRRIVDEARAETRKSPSLALALGIVPGLGQIYSGRVASGLASFALNAVLIGVTAYGFDRREYAFATLSTVATAGIYFGGMYAGYESARRYNELRDTEARDRIRGVKLELKLLELAL